MARFENNNLDDSTGQRPTMYDESQKKQGRPLNPTPKSNPNPNLFRIVVFEVLGLEPIR